MKTVLCVHNVNCRISKRSVDCVVYSLVTPLQGLTYGFVRECWAATSATLHLGVRRHAHPHKRTASCPPHRWHTKHIPSLCDVTRLFVGSILTSAFWLLTSFFCLSDFCNVCGVWVTSIVWVYTDSSEKKTSFLSLFHIPNILDSTNLFSVNLLYDCKCLFLFAGRGQPTTLWWPLFWSWTLSDWVGNSSKTLNHTETVLTLQVIIFFPPWMHNSSRGCSQRGVWIHVGQKSQLHGLAGLSLYLLTVHVYTLVFSMCSMDVIKKTVCLGVCTSIQDIQ